MRHAPNPRVLSVRKRSATPPCPSLFDFFALPRCSLFQLRASHQILQRSEDRACWGLWWGRDFLLGRSGRTC